MWLWTYRFNPLDRGNLYQMMAMMSEPKPVHKAFQSPRSGKFVSDIIMAMVAKNGTAGCFNPLDRGNLYQIKTFQDFVATVAGSFQSPRSGKFVSDKRRIN